MELKLRTEEKQNEEGRLLIVLNGIETKNIEESVRELKAFNRTKWN